MPRRSLKRRVTYQIVVHTIKDSFSCWHEQLGIVEHSLRKFRPQSLCYPVFRERVTDALEDSSRVSVAVWWTKTGTRKSWFRINCACVKLFTYLTKRSCRGSAVARLDLFGGVGGGGVEVGENHKPRRRELLGGFGGMLTRKILNYTVSQIAFSAFTEHLFPAIFLCWSHKYIYRTEMSTLNRKAAWRAWLLTKLNLPVKIIGGGGGRPPDPSPCYGTAREFCLAPTLLQFTRSK